MFKFRFGSIARHSLVQISSVHILLLSVSLLAFAATFSPVVDWLFFDRQLVEYGQYWRPFCAWLTHSNVFHWLINQWGLVVMFFLLPKRLSPCDWLVFLAIWLACSVALWNSNYLNYYGLSGVLYGWLVYAAWITPFYARWIVWLVIGAISIKVFAENSFPYLLQSTWLSNLIDANIAYRSHLWGLVSGLFAIAVRYVARRFP